MIDERCENCRFWVRADEYAMVGWCHRMPPLAHPGIMGSWPKTMESDWCGEWAEKERREHD